MVAAVDRAGRSGTKEAIMKGQIHWVLGTTGAALVCVALLAGGALAADRPDDRAGAIGVGGVAFSSMPSDVVERAVARHGSESEPTDVLGRAVARHTADLASLERGFAGPVRPDDRPGARGAGLAAGATPSTVATEPGDRFAWGDAAFGAAATFGLLVALGAIATLTLRHRGRALAR
jgi:hypothetical protein